MTGPTCTSSFPDHFAQRGAVLVVALIFLVLLTVLALSASGSSLLQSKMVAATRNSQLAQLGAESALRGAEWRLWMASERPSTRLHPGVSGFYIQDLADPNTAVNDFRSTPGWDPDKYEGGSDYSAYTGLDFSGVGAEDAPATLAANPVYIIEDLGVEMPAGVNTPKHESCFTGPCGRGARSIDRHVFRITARSPGANTKSVKLMQSIFSAKAD